MDMPEIDLDLSKHCIETAVKRAYNRLLSQYFQRGGAEAALEGKLALLQGALARFDFPALRATHRKLQAGSRARVTLRGQDGGGVPVLSVDGRPVDTGFDTKS